MIEHTNETCHYDDEHSCEQVAALEIDVKKERSLAEQATRAKRALEARFHAANETRLELEADLLNARNRATEAEARVKRLEDELGTAQSVLGEDEARAEKAEAELAAERERVFQYVAHDQGSHDGCSFSLPEALQLKRAAGRESGQGESSPAPLKGSQPTREGARAQPEAAAKPAARDYLTAAARGENRKAYIVSTRRHPENEECET